VELNRLQRPERPEGSESLSVRNGARSDEQSVTQSARSEKGAAGGEEFTTKPGASEIQDQEETRRGSVRVKRSGGAPDDRRSGRRRSGASTLPRHKEPINPRGGAYAAGGEAPPLAYQNRGGADGAEWRRTWRGVTNCIRKQFPKSKETFKFFSVEERRIGWMMKQNP